ncbi:TetR/AcrR family transcriptional regulator [Vibrio sp. E150_011]
MAKATAEQAAQTRQRIVNVALDITIEDGFESATLGNIAKRLSISRSGVNAHFPRREHMAKELAPMIIHLIIEPLNFSSCEAFYDSWIYAINSNTLFRGAIRAIGPIVPSRQGIIDIADRIQCDDEERRLTTTYTAIGYAVAHLDETDGALHT